MPIPEQISSQGVLTFPEGLPGLGDWSRFVLLRPDGLDPILLLQSVEQEHVSMPVIPMHTVRSDYRLELSAADRRAIEAAEDDDSASLVCLSVLLLGKDGAAACNLMAPIVLNPRTMLAKQVVQLDSDYPALQSLTELGEE